MSIEETNIQELMDEFATDDNSTIINRAMDQILERLKPNATEITEDQINEITRLVTLAVLDGQMFLLKSARDFLDEGFKESVKEFIQTRDA